ncbi:glycine cleavage system aminomethyltransferase GcvT [Plantibacter sp. YIM 135249]|uniref:glycine cleavage system aminomethyltransferase GcvT n=1 Tax=Plantibacter sp. YIM 135249 TaxID=3423918 RepID=UPI003D3548EA
MTDLERTSPLHAVHEAAGASFTDFAGWQMPVRYSSDLAEHHAVRTAAGIFDLSHMAEILVTGPDAGAFLDAALAGKLSAIALWQAKYSLILNAQGGIVDDIVVYRLADERFLVIANAGNREAAFQALSERAADFDVTVEDQSDATALIAVQGPASRAILESVAEITDLGTPLAELGYYRCTDAFFDGLPLLVARTGYTGEDGFELYVQVDAAERLWRAIESAGASRGLVPAGLASRDTLRLEAGMPLYGHELGTGSFPVQAGLGRVVALSKPGPFVGREAVEAGPHPDAPVLVALVSEGRRAGRAGYAVFDGDTEIGAVTSGALSPTLGHPIAMAYVHPDQSATGTVLTIDVRGTKIPATVTTLPFYTREK